MAEPTRRELLRAATHGAHAALDAEVGKLDFTDTGHYLSFLERSARALLPLEEQLDAAGVSGWLPDWPARRRSEALRADVLMLGGRIAALDPLPRWPGRRRLTAAEALGVLYVLEGSRLGAQMLVTRLPVSAPRRYLAAGIGQADGSQRGRGHAWRTFLGVLETSPHWKERLTPGAATWSFVYFARAFAAPLRTRSPAAARH